jgi:signal transduction histidine kinase
MRGFARSLAWSLCLGWFALWMSSAWAQTPEPVRWIDKAQISVQTQADESWRELGEQKLPWRWDTGFSGQSGVAALQMSFDRQYHARSQSLGLGVVSTGIGNRYRYRVNAGAWIEHGWAEPSSHARVGPQWLRLSTGDLLPGLNTLRLEIRADPANEAGFTPLYLDDEHRAGQYYEQIHDRRMLSTLVVAMISMLTGVWVLGIWMVNRGAVFLYSGAAEVLFALRQFGTLVEYPPLPTWMWNALSAIAFAFYVGLVCKSSLHLTQNAWPKFKKWGGVYLWSSAPVLLLGFALGNAHAYKLWAGLMLLMTLTHVAHLNWQARRQSQLDIKLFALAGWAALLVGAWDFVVIQLMPDGLGRWRMGTYASLFFNLTLTWMVIHRFMLTQAQLVQSKARNQADAENAKFEERQRIMADLHDSVGAQLVGIQSMLKTHQTHEAVGEQVGHALDELRMTVDALQPVHGRLEVVLASLRHRIAPRLQAAGLTLVWHVDALPTLDSLNPQSVQHIQKIVLEALSNIIRHAFAKRIEIRVTHEAGAQAGEGLCRISISDDGCSMTESSSQGQGLRNMQLRADKLGGQLFVHSEPSQGTRVELTLPIKAN